MTPAEILRQARDLCDRDQTMCAHLAICDATCGTPDMEPEPVLQLFAEAIGVDISAGHNPIWRWWDAASLQDRAAAWERTIALAEQP